jgi:hypothetical protein
LAQDLREKTKWARKSDAVILACCRTWWLASSYNRWWVMVFLEYITTLYVNSVDSVERCRGHKTETWYSEQKSLFTIMWNPGGFYIIDRLPNDAKMNSDYFVTNMIIPLEQAIFPRGRAPPQRRLVVHLGDCLVHTSRASTDWLREYGMRRMSHPPILFAWFGPSDFYLFPTVKEKPERIPVADEDQFLSHCKRFWGVLIKKNWMVYFRLGCGGFKK